MANDVYQLTILGTVADEFFENVLHFESNQTAGSNPTQAASSLIGVFRDIFEPAILDCVCVDSEITGYKSKRVNNGGSPYIALPITPQPGTVAGTSATSATCSLVHAPFQRAGKFYTGKVFIPGLSESVLTGNTISAPQLANVNTFADLLTDQYSDSPYTWEYVIWSRTVSLPFIPYDIFASAHVAIQRRRLQPFMS